MIFKDFPILEHWICFNKISVPFTSPLSVTVGHLRIRFHGEGHRSIADRRLHMLAINDKRSSDLVFQHIAEIFWLPTKCGTYSMSHFRDLLSLRILTQKWHLVAKIEF